MGVVKNVQDRKNGEGQLTYGGLKRRVWGSIENKSLLDNMMDKEPEKWNIRLRVLFQHIQGNVKWSIPTGFIDQVALLSDSMRWRWSKEVDT